VWVYLLSKLDEKQVSYLIGVRTNMDMNFYFRMKISIVKLTPNQPHYYHQLQLINYNFNKSLIFK